MAEAFNISTKAKVEVKKKYDNNNKFSLPESYIKTIKTFYPKLGELMCKIKDPRMKGKIKYDLSVILWIGILLFCFKLESVRNINYLIGYYSDSEFLENFKKIFSVLGITQKQLERIPDFATLIYSLKKLDEKELEKLQVLSIKQIMRQKVFDKFKLFDQYYQIAIDATREVVFDKQHCEHCLRRKIGKDDKGENIYQYYHYLLSVSLVGQDGFSIPILIEFIENESQDVTKQDCELKAFYRASERLKEYFPRAKICLQMDSLYACQQVMSICEKNDWKYIINFKSGSIPTLYKEYESLLNRCPENKTSVLVDKNISQQIVWVNDMNYEGHTVNIIDCKETTKTAEKESTKLFRYITNFTVTYQNSKAIIKGGRCRWSIENAFNSQKNNGYNLTHMYAKNWSALKNFCRLLIIGFSISKLIESGSLLKDIKKTFGSFKNFYLKLFIAFTEHSFDQDAILSILNSKYQIRLNSS